MADRFYCPDPAVAGRLTITGEEARHLAKVRRLGPGDRVELFDGGGGAVQAEVVTVGRDRVELQTVGEPLEDRTPACRLTLATAVPKGERFDWLVEKATELGVVRLIPLITERSVVDPRAAKLERLRRCVIEAAKQCGRNRLMELDPPTSWASLVAGASADSDLRLMAHPDGVRPSQWPRAGSDRSVLLAVGPEGGFTDAEVDLARSQGWSIVGLGATILRIETAGLVGCATVLARCVAGED